MTERLADISARIDGIRQLGSVVNAMKGIASARAHVARAQVVAVDSYAATLATAMAQVLGAGDRTTSPAGRIGLLVFGAEQGFAGAFSERVLDTVATDNDVPVFLVGTRGLSVAASRGVTPHWHTALPSQSTTIPKRAEAITAAVLAAVAQGQIDSLDVIHTSWAAGRAEVVRHRLFPLDLAALPAVSGAAVLTQLPAAALRDSIGQDYLHALITRAALHAFAAENEARMQAMTAAGHQISEELTVFQAKLRRVRQEAITAEIIELGTGAAAAGQAT
ncbi:F0F1 ATP synthase subunit gamma [Loktanella sp. M215]|uniref:F0F1 ATP synthase subunit gamma n=1 Tax=Loktanella sp. M215 TaxID=2675431 RepID=UPI001F36B510|nr:FoF1 ATP synthase subunit gamma [Loktanella sp. M215]MCF7701439.1 F0F1 ATP synthase subunit gamma [Loktanella sp. M215]